MLPNFRKFKDSSTEREDIIPGVPVFKPSQYQKLKILGRGSFGEVTLHTPILNTGHSATSKFVALKSFIDADRDLLRKEVKLLASFNHPNVIRILGYYGSKYPAIAMEYASFDLRPFGKDMEVSSLSDLLRTLDDIDFEGFQHLPVFIMRDVSNGLAYLHEMKVAHRDLKPDNVLVSNLHYTSSASSVSDMGAKFQSEPIIAKLADFGESRSAAIQTASLIQTR